MRGWARLRAARQSRLMGVMMEHLGIDPAAAALRGRAFDAATRRCLWCAASGQCGQWLESADARDRAPAFCPNAAFFNETCSRS
jgi:hypothetical protein